MAVELTMPQMDQTMTTGKVGKWLVKEGDAVKQGDPVLEIETDKVVHELESPSNGNIAQLLVEEGRKVPVNAVLAIIAAPGEKVERRSVTPPAKAKAGKPESRRAAKPEIQRTSVAVYPSPVPTSVRASPASRSLAQQHNVDLTQVKGSGPVGRIVESDVQAYIDSLSPEPAVSERLKASPLARRLAKEHGLDLTVIAGSGPGGRIVRDDVFKAAEAAVAVPAEPIPAVQPEVAPVQVIPMTGIRQIIAERMTLSAQTTACVTLNTEVDVTELVELRTWLNQKLSAKEISLTYTDLLVKIIAHALRQHPRLNSTLAEDGIHLIEQINIGVAVALEDGLVVPVVTNADQKGVSVISREIKALAEKARNNQLRPGDLRGGTFTLTNLG
ncbi:2-oxo acid dehydrogenase subunit E2, partial [Candidatus Poribacteria bacterium]|nr:2-oxo acid dehydrogenase subunit E2 [Candidatus Poribacteria bacterium]